MKEVNLRPPQHFPKHASAVSDKNIILQFESPDDASSAEILINDHKDKLMGGTFSQAIL